MTNRLHHIVHRWVTVLIVVFCGITVVLAQQTRDPESARRDFPVPADIKVVRDVVYAEYGARQLKLDVYLPPRKDPRTAAPGVLVVRGGGWRTGDKEFFGFIAGQLAKRGFVAASIEYRTVQEAKFPAAEHDVKAAVRWMRSHAATYGVDPNAIGALGTSAGAHLVALLGTSNGVSDLEGDGGNAGVSSQVQAVVAMACVCVIDAQAAKALGADANTHTIESASPVTFVSRESAPLLLLHSPTDPLVPFELSVEMDARYRRAGAPVTLTKVDAPKTHGFWLQTPYFPDVMKRASDFFRSYLKPKR